MLRSLFILDAHRWYTRLPLKWMILGFTTLFVCFPYPGLTLRHVRHWMNPDALIEPDAPSLQPWVEELRPKLSPELPPRDALRLVEKFVYEKVPYEWDWNTWGLGDYLPTVAEVIAKGKEDCDGRAVIAASLLRNFGFKSRIVTDFAHVWVATDKGETMGPGKRKAIVATDKGMKIDWGALVQLPNVLAYGIAVFPWPREVVILVVAWWLLLDRRTSRRRAIVCAILFAAALILIRWSGDDYWHPVRWVRWSGVAVLVLVPLGMIVAGRRAARVRNAASL